MVRVNLEVDDGTKEKWITAANESEVARTLSAFIRHAVEREIAGAHDVGGRVGVGDESETGIGNQLNLIVDQLDTLNDRIEHMDTRLRSIESVATPTPHSDELTTEVFELLPDAEPGTEEWSHRRESLRMEHGQSDPRTVAWEGTLSALAEAVGEPEPVIEDALDTLRNDTHLIHEADVTTTGGEPRYYKEV